MRYWKSPQGVAEFAKIGKPYPDTEFDKAWEKHLRRLEHDPNKKEVITQLKRMQVAEDVEFLVYTHTVYGHDDIGSYCEKSQAGIGIYPILRPINQRILNEDNQYETVTTSYTEELGYFIPFNKEMLERLHKLCNDSTVAIKTRTKYSVQPDGGTEIAVASYEDFANGDFEDLYKNGRITARSKPTINK